MTRPAKLLDGSVTEPLRIVVAGNSASVFVTPPRRVHAEGTYGELLPRLLADADIDATVRHTGKWHDMIHELRRRYEFSVRNHFPEVLVLNYGMAELQPRVVPTWLVRHFTSWDQSGHAVARAVRTRVYPPLWRAVRKWQQQASRTARPHTWRVSPDRFRRELTKVVTMAREDVQCLVLVLDIDPPGDRLSHWLPGIDQRWELFQDTLRRTIDDLHDPEVRLVATSTSLHEPATDIPDGLHRTAKAHLAAAEMIAQEILRWLDERSP